MLRRRTRRDPQGNPWQQLLVSEALRGEGAVLRDGAGERFMLGVHELAPRDVVAKAITRVQHATTVVGTAVAMAAMSGRLSLLSLIVLPPAIWLTRKVARMRRTITAQGQRYLADLQSQVEEGLSVSGVLLGKTLGAGPAQSASRAPRPTWSAWQRVRLVVPGRLTLRQKCGPAVRSNRRGMRLSPKRICKSPSASM
jgi:hypothetical protein